MPYAPALPDGPVRGSYSFETATFTILNFAGTRPHLYLQQTGSQTFNNVSGPGAPYNTDPGDDGFWSFTSFGKRIIATNYNDPIQTFLAGTDTAFSNLAAAAPNARYCAVIRDFLMVANTNDAVSGPMAHRVWWPAIGNPLSWPTPGTDPAIQVQSDYQDLEQTDLGSITGIVGGHLSQADGAVLCERGIYRIQYAGSPAVFDFAVAQGSAGTEAPLSIVNRRIAAPGGSFSSVIYYYSTDGFSAFDGSSSIGIGSQKVDKYVLANLDPNRTRAMQGVYDPLHKLVMWFFHAPGNNGLFNAAVIFNWELQQWAPIDVSATPVAWVAGEMSATQGYTLDQLDYFPNGPTSGIVTYNLETLPYSFDSRAYTGAVPQLTWFDGNNQQCFITGPSLPATVETGEQQLFPGRRSRIMNTRPIADSVVPVSISIGAREKVRDAVVYTGAIPENVLGDCPQRSTGRYTRFRMVVPSGANFNHLQGIDVSARPEGIR